MKLAIGDHKFTAEEMRELERLHREAVTNFQTWGREVLEERLKNLPENWTLTSKGMGASFFFVSRGGLRVMLTAEIHADGRRWIHVSTSRENRLPNWNDLKVVKETFLGDESEAIQIFAPKSQWVNDHPYCLHLWSCVSEKIVPDFRQNVGGIVSI